jgi:hypothetical protein
MALQKVEKGEEGQSSLVVSGVVDFARGEVNILSGGNGGGRTLFKNEKHNPTFPSNF